MPVPRKDFEDIKHSMGKRSAGEFVRASGRSDAEAKKKKVAKKMKRSFDFERYAKGKAIGSNPPKSYKKAVAENKGLGMGPKGYVPDIHDMEYPSRH